MKTPVGDLSGGAAGTREDGPRRASAEVGETVWREAPVGVCELDSIGRCRAVNPAWSGMTGIAADRATGDGWMRCVHPDDRAACLAR